jgi:glutathione synthase/RimK-type ligase-like ATP-grasp enzyme
MPAADGNVDNFGSGGIASPVDLDSGRLGPAIKLLHATVFENHPTTGARIAGVQVPLWQETIALCIKAHRFAENFTFLGWDLAVTDDGPKLIECNVWPQSEISQVPHGRGLLEDNAILETIVQELNLKF